MKTETTSSANLPHIRHTLSHLLAAAVLELYPGTQNTLGPAIDNGFYYDFDFSKAHSADPRKHSNDIDDVENPSKNVVAISEKDLPVIEKKMRAILKDWKKFEHKEVSPTEAKKIYADNPYKIELIDEITARSERPGGGTGEKITLYTVGMNGHTTDSPESKHAFTDLCRGGHTDNPAADIAPDSFKLSHIAGAYWRGDEKNAMLTRIYGLAFENKAALDAYENMMVEAEKRDHKKLGKELKLFTSSALVGSGLPLIQPKGMIIRKEIEDYLWELHRDRGYDRVWTPHIAKEELYITSGHAAKFGDELFRVQGKEETFFLKPMNCPHHMQIFADNQFSYRDMPVRYFEPATVYRDEKSGQLAGLTRVRSITQDDGHLFCRVSQIEQEVSTIVEVIKEFYTTFGMMNGYWVSLSVRSARAEDTSKYLGTDEVWKTAETALEKAAKANGLNYRRVEGEATFYGPKLDFMFKDAIGREWQLATIQCDFNLPERFDLSFINENSDRERPVVIHRAISGSLERFMGIIIEHYGGNFPLWLSPVQVKVIPVAEAFFATAEKVHDALRAETVRGARIRSELDLSRDSFGKKVRNAKTAHIPYFIIIGEKDEAAGKVTLESRDHGQVGQLIKEEVTTRLIEEIKTRK